MDAISFVLGLDAKKLRGTSLSDLVHDDGSGGARPVDCSVRMIFMDGTGQEHVFTRSVVQETNSNGSISWKSGYSYDGKTTKKAYETALGEVGVSVTIPNCLVFQVRIQNQPSPFLLLKRILLVPVRP